MQAAIARQDVVYANLAGQLERQAECIVRAMNANRVKRLIFISSMGIYDEIPGERSGPILEPYRKAAKVIEASELDYTIVRPAWLNDRDEIDYGTTQKGELFKNSSETVPEKECGRPRGQARNDTGVERSRKSWGSSRVLTCRPRKRYSVSTGNDGPRCVKKYRAS